jgi:hypothetical protein
MTVVPGVQAEHRRQRGEADGVLRREVEVVGGGEAILATAVGVGVPAESVAVEEGGDERTTSRLALRTALEDVKGEIRQVLECLTAEMIQSRGTSIVKRPASSTPPEFVVSRGRSRHTLHG